MLYKYIYVSAINMCGTYSQEMKVKFVRGWGWDVNVPAAFIKHDVCRYANIVYMLI